MEKFYKIMACIHKNLLTIVDLGYVSKLFDI